MQDFLFANSTEITSAVQNAAQESGSNKSVVILITGFVVVFAMLLLLIGIIKIYSGIVSSVDKKINNKKAKKDEVILPQTSNVAGSPQITETFDDGLDLQTVAVITAAVEAFYSKGKKVRITGIRPSNNARNEWASAGLAQNIPAMRSEGLL